MPGLDDYLGMDLNLQSQRLTLTPYTADDLDLSFEVFTDPAVMKYTGGAMSEHQIRASVPNWTRRGGDGYIGVWTVSHRRTGEKYGSVALLPMPIEEKTTDYDLVVPGEMPSGDIEIGYYMKRSAWGFGYATEASRRMLAFAFEETPLQEVVATFDAKNLASRKVLKKAGFIERGTMRCYGQDGGVNFRITRDEWLREA
ncbi:MAG: GNAT family N-acetyltransferase [Woeseiaceae bacterium]|nr:GNAT family N-acetyltransferase [Woeseiaceae bacterium]